MDGYVTERGGHEIVVQEPIDHKELKEAILNVKNARFERNAGEKEDAFKILLDNWANDLATDINRKLKSGTMQGFMGSQFLRTPYSLQAESLRVDTSDISEYLKRKGIPVKMGIEIMDEHRRMLQARERLGVAKELQGSHGLSRDIQDMIAGHMSVRGAGQGGGKLKRRMKKSKRSKRKGKSKKKSKRTKKQQRKR